jgi:acyl-CoA thioester hydrolase
MSVDYIGKVHWPGDVELGTGIQAVGKSSGRMGQALFNGDRCVGSAETVLVMVDEHTRKPCEIPEWVKNYLCGFSI